MSFLSTIIALVFATITGFFHEPVSELAGASITTTTTVAALLSQISTAESSFPKPVQIMANAKLPPNASYTFPITVPDNVTIDTYSTNGYIVTITFSDHEEVYRYVNGLQNRTASNSFITASTTP